MNKKQKLVFDLVCLWVVIIMFAALNMLVSSRLEQPREFVFLEEEVIWKLNTEHYSTDAIGIHNVGGDPFKYSYGFGNTFEYEEDGFSVRIGEIVDRSEDKITITTVARMNVTVEGVVKSVLLLPVNGEIVAFRCDSLQNLGITMIDPDHCTSTFASEQVFQQFAEEAKLRAADYGLTLYVLESHLLSNPDPNEVVNEVFTTVSTYTYR